MLFAIDLPAVFTLTVFRPALQLLLRILLSWNWRSIKVQIEKFLMPLPFLSRFAIAICLDLDIPGVTTLILVFNKPSKIISKYEVFKLETWIGKELPILGHIDITKLLKKGTGTEFVLLYHHDYPNCARVIPMYKQTAWGLAVHEDFANVVPIKVLLFGPSRFIVGGPIYSANFPRPWDGSVQPQLSFANKSCQFIQLASYAQGISDSVNCLTDDCWGTRALVDCV